MNLLRKIKLLEMYWFKGFKLLFYRFLCVSIFCEIASFKQTLNVWKYQNINIKSNNHWVSVIDAHTIYF